MLQRRVRLSVSRVVGFKSVRLISLWLVLLLVHLVFQAPALADPPPPATDSASDTVAPLSEPLPTDPDSIEDFVPDETELQAIEAAEGEVTLSPVLSAAGDAVAFNDQVAVIVESGTFTTSVALAFALEAVAETEPPAEAESGTETELAEDDLNAAPESDPPATEEAATATPEPYPASENDAPTTDETEPPTPLVLQPDESVELLRFEIEAVDPATGAVDDEFNKQVRFVIDVRDLPVTVDSDLHEYYLAYENPDEPGFWIDVPIIVHQEEGLISADVDHFSNWALGARPEQWALSYNPPVVSEFSGAATYGYSIDVPPGRGGLQPSVNLSYSSRSIDGATTSLGSAGDVAHGWSLAEMKIIRDKVNVGPSNNGNTHILHPDKFYLVMNGAGYELFPDGSTTANTLRYYARDNPAIRIYRYYNTSAPNDEKLFWVVTTPDGTQYRFGYTAAAEETHRVDHTLKLTIAGHRGLDTGGESGWNAKNTSAIAWRVDTVTDVWGNQVIYDYNTFENTDTYPVDSWGWQLVVKHDKTRLSYIAYNFPGRQPVTNSTIPATVGRFSVAGNNPATVIYFAHVVNATDNEWSHGTPSIHEVRSITRIAVYHAPNLGLNVANPNKEPIAEYRLAQSTHTYAACHGTTTVIDSITRHAQTDASLTTDDTGVTLPATTFGYESKPNGGGDCWQYRRLSRVDNGYGGYTRFVYTADGRYHEDVTYCQYGGQSWPCQWIPRIGQSYYVTQQYTGSGIGNESKITYTYGTPCYNQTNTQGGNVTLCTSGAPEEYGPLVGFSYTDRRIYATATAVELRIRSTFNQTSGSLAQGKVTKVETFDSSGKKLAQVEHAYTAMFFGNGLTFMRESSVTQTQYDGANSIVTKTEYEYDTTLQGGVQYGNLTVVRNLGDMAITGDEQTTLTRYYPDSTRWIVASAAKQRVIGGSYNASAIDLTTLPGGALLAEQRTLYRGNTGYAETPKYPVPAESQVLVDGVDTFMTNQKATYDAYSNVLTQQDTRASNYGINSGVVLTITYESTYNLYPIAVSDNHDNHTTFETYSFYETSPQYTAGFGGAYRPNGLLKTVYQKVGENDPQPDSYISTWYEYDPFGRLYATYDAPGDRGVLDKRFDGDPSQRIHYYDNAWNASADLVWVNPAGNKPFLIATLTRPGSVTTAYGSGTTGLHNDQTLYDGLGRVIQTRSLWAEVPGQTDRRDEIITTTQYNALGQVVCQTVPFTVQLSDDRGAATPASPYVTDSCTGKSHTATTYDVLGRVKNITGPDGKVTANTYAILATGQINNSINGTLSAPDYRSNATNTPFPNHIFHVQTTIDANNRARTQLSNALGQMVYVLEYTGSSAPYTLYATTTYGYDLRGNLIHVIDQNKNRTIIQYDSLGRKTSMTDPDMGTWSYNYDVSGNMIFQKDARSQRLCFYYDAQNRLTTKSTHTNDTCPAEPAPTHSSVLATYSYDTATNGLGQLASSTWRRTSSAFDNESFTYDSRGRLKAHTRNIDGRSYSQTVQAYDTLNRPTQVVYPGGQTVAIGYDREGEETLTVGSTALVDALKYNERGQLTQIDRSDTTYDVNFSYYGATNNFRLQHIATSGMFVQNNFQYDAVGNILGFSRHLLTQTSENLTFTYDALNRLTNAQGTGNSAVEFNDSFAYSPIGNLTSFDGVSQSYTTGTTRPHAVTMVGDRSYFYDANGNLTRIDNDYVTERTLGWNAENRLTSVTENGQTTQFRYDPAGIRTTVINPDGSKLLQPFPHYEASYAGGSLINQRTTFTLGGQLIALEQDGTLFYAHTDHLGSPTALMQKQGEVFVSSSIARYKPYGGYLTQPTATALDRGYTGHDRTAADDGLGLVYMNARYFDPSLGRFISADTLVPDPADPQSFNRYSYVFNNAINLTDPSGHCPWCVSALAGAATDTVGQMMLNYFFDPNVSSFEDVWNSINWGQVGWSALEGLVMPGGRLGAAVAGAAGEVAINAATAWFEGTSYTAQQALADFAFGFVANLAGEAMGDLISRYGDDAVRAGMNRLQGACASNSFTAETLVATADGLQPISDIDIGDLVLAYDEVSGITDYYPVTWVWAHAGDTLAVLELEGETIEATLAHPFYVEATGWVDAGALRPGMAVRQADGTSGLVTAVTFEASAEVVYNLTVAGAHTFFVGDGAWLVHNCNESVYSVFFEAEIPSVEYGRSRHRHNQIANEQLNAAMNSDEAFQSGMTELGVNQSELVSSTGTGSRRSPSNFTWHHAEQPGSLQLVSRTSHQTNSRLFHPRGYGGYKMWGD